MADSETDVPIPPPLPTDPEDVSWALSTAEAMWSRGDMGEALKWLRRAAEAASEAEADERALALAKAAANLSNRVGRRSAPSMPAQGGSSAAALLEATPAAAAANPGNAPQPPEPYHRRIGSSLPPQGTGAPRSAPPTAVRPSSPVHTAVTAPQASPPSQSPGSSAPHSSPPGSGSPTPRPPVPSNRAPAPGMPSPPSSPPISHKPISSHAVPVPRSALDSGRFEAQPESDPFARRSDSRMRVATQPDPSEARIPAAAQAPTFDDDTSDHTPIPAVLPTDEESWAPSPPSSAPPPPSSSASSASIGLRPVGDNTAQMPALTELNAIEVLRGRRPLKALSSASDWDAVPTKTLSGSDLSDLSAFQPSRTTIEEVSPPSSPKAPSAPPRSERGSEERRPALATSQAVRVILWKDANGVHVAPHGTLVSAITVDAMVVALDPSADIRAWLDPSHRKNNP